jgi:hypothetical protein
MCHADFISPVNIHGYSDEFCCSWWCLDLWMRMEVEFEEIFLLEPEPLDLYPDNEEE